MSSSSFGVMPSEIKVKIFSCCQKKDLLNVAVCSKDLCEEVLPILWNDIKIVWDDLDSSTNNSSFKVLEHLRHTSQLRLRDGVNAPEQRIFYRSLVFGLLVRSCDPNQLQLLSLVGCIPEDGLQLLAKVVPMIRHFELSSVKLSAWDSLACFKH